MHAFRAAALVSLVSTAAVAEPEQVKSSPDDPKLELEIGAGAAARTEVSPTVSARIGVDFWNWFTPSVRVLSVEPWAGAQSAWAIQAELRGHTKGSLLQLTGGIGLGLATANVVRSDAGLDASVSRPAQPWLTGDLGARLLLGPVFIGVSVGGAPLQQQWLGSLSLGVIAFGS